MPDPAEIESLITRRTRAIVVINPNNPTGATYPRSVLEAIARLAERHQLVVFSDEIYDQMVYDGAESIPMATLVRDTLCATLSGSVEDLSRLRLSGRLGGVLGPAARRERLSVGAGAAVLAAIVQQRAGAVGRADGPGRLSEHSRAGQPGRAACTSRARRCSRR